MDTIIKDTELQRIPGTLKPDSRKRVVLPKSLAKEGIVYHIYCNKLGQIILDPQVTVSISEAWLFQNPKALAAVNQGLDDATRGNVSKMDMDLL